MVDDPYHPEPPFTYECTSCENRFESADISTHDDEGELVACPDCGGTLWNITMPSGE